MLGNVRYKMTCPDYYYRACPTQIIKLAVAGLQADMRFSLPAFRLPETRFLDRFGSIVTSIGQRGISRKHNESGLKDAKADIAEIARVAS